MVRLNEIDKNEAEHLLKLECEVNETSPFVTGPPLTKSKLALISTAGLHRRGDAPFTFGSSDYRVIPAETPANELIMSHISTNYDRTGFVQDLNVVFPLDRLRELVDLAVIGSLAEHHYSFMGATDPKNMEESAKEIAGLMKAEGVGAVLLVPV